MTLEEFQAADLRVATITAAEKVEGSEKLLKLQLDVGPSFAAYSAEAASAAKAGEASEGREPRQIVSGIAKQYAPESLVGKQVVIIANLDPRMMMGLESKGMLLAAHGENGEPVILTVEKPVPAGSKIS